MTDEDKSNIKDLSTEFEVDFISLSFTRSGEDIQSAREFLDSINMTTTKVLLRFLCMCMFVLVLKRDKMLPELPDVPDVECASHCQDISEDEKCGKIPPVSHSPSKATQEIVWDLELCKSTDCTEGFRVHGVLLGSTSKHKPYM